MFLSYWPQKQLMLLNTRSPQISADFIRNTAAWCHSHLGGSSHPRIALDASGSLRFPKKWGVETPLSSSFGSFGGVLDLPNPFFPVWNDELDVQLQVCFLEELSLPPPKTYPDMFGFKRSGWRMLFFWRVWRLWFLGHLPMVLFSSHPSFVNIWVSIWVINTKSICNDIVLMDQACKSWYRKLWWQHRMTIRIYGNNMNIRISTITTSHALKFVKPSNCFMQVFLHLMPWVSEPKLLPGVHHGCGIQGSIMT